ncbi:MAG: ABC transporter permease [Planctomycetota bacterium]|jgi:ABC-type nitrate/sulfonate/bicarbonate transport system permease component|nr:ABC transporter permease [Planctomycetota bacterium]
MTTTTARQTPPVKGKPLKRKTEPICYIAPIILFVAVVAAWALFVSASGISRTILPSPFAIFREMSKNFVRDILPHLLFTLRVILTGYAVAVPLGILIAAVCSQYRIIIKATTPLIILLVVTPMITMVPLFMLWMGFDSKVRVIVVILQATPIICLNTLTGFTTTEGAKLELMRAMGATRLQTFVKLIFPNALPQVFTGLKLGCIFSTIAAMSADLAAGKEGLGYRIQQYSSLIMTEMAYGTILIVALIGIVLFQIVVMIERRVILWVR